MRYSNTGIKQPNSAYNANNPWENPRFTDIRRHDIGVRKQYGLPLNDNVQEDPIEVIAVKDPETGQWKNRICNTLTNVCFYVAIAAAVTKAKGLWGGRRTRRKRKV